MTLSQAYSAPKYGVRRSSAAAAAGQEAAFAACGLSVHATPLCDSYRSSKAGPIGAAWCRLSRFFTTLASAAPASPGLLSRATSVSSGKSP